jgi:hypothetical protein
MMPVPVHERRSKALFGNKDMLTLCGTIAGFGQRFTASQMSTAANLGYSTSHRLLGALTSAGLLTREARSAGEREQWYTRQNHRFWDAARDLHEDPVGDGGNSAQ